MSETITAADASTPREQFNRALTEIKSLRERGAQLEQLTDGFKRELKALRESSVSSHRAPTENENQIQARYIEQGSNGSPSVRMFGAERGGVYAPGLLDDTTTCGEWHHNVKRAAENVSLVALVRCRDSRDLRDPMAIARLAPKSIANLNFWMKRAPTGIQRIFNSTTATGGAFIPDEIRSPEVMMAAELQSADTISALFRSAPMTGPTVINPFIASGGLTPYAMGAASSDDPSQFKASSLSTAERSRTAKRFGVRTVIDSEADEDSIVSSRQVLISQIATAIAYGREDSILNGDDASSHQDTGIASWNPRSMWSSSALGSSVDHRRLWTGLRARVGDLGSGSKSDLSTFNYANLLALKAKLDAPLGRDGSVVLMVPAGVYISDILGLTQVATMEKYGPSASVVSGEVARLGGMRVVVPHMLTEDLNASGIYDGTTTTKGQVLICNTDRFQIGVRRGLETEMDKDITRGVHHIVASVREIFWTLDGSSTSNVVQGYNI